MPDDLPALLVPWFLFAIVFVTTVLLDDLTLSYIAVVLGSALGVGFLLLSSGRAWKVLAVVCLIGVALGEVVGMYGRQRYLSEYYAYLETEAFGLDKLVFIKGSNEPEIALAETYREAQEFVIYTLLTLFGVALMATLLLSCLGCSLTDGGEEQHWHADKAARVMKFGIEFVPQQWGRMVRLDLLHNRCYYSGEVIYDYAFHMANKHLFLGVFSCHPAHPYSKWERLITCTLVCLFIVFPVSACSVKLGDDGLLHDAVICACVTLPRNLLKVYLNKITQQDEVEELEEGHRPAGDHVSRALQWEIAFLALCVLSCALTVGVCVLYIKSASSLYLGQVLADNCDGLGWAFILEPLFDLVIPFLGLHTKDSSWTLGFFGRWRQERQYYEAIGSIDMSPKAAGKQGVLDSLG